MIPKLLSQSTNSFMPKQLHFEVMYCWKATTQDFPSSTTSFLLVQNFEENFLLSVNNHAYFVKFLATLGEQIII